MLRLGAVVLLAGLGVTEVAGAQQTLADRLRNVGTKTVAFNARARAGVCGDGKSSYNDGLTSPTQNTRYIDSNSYFSYDGSYYTSDGMTLVTYEPWDTRIAPCEPGPVRVTLRIVDNQPSLLRLAVGPLAPLPDSIVNLGAVSTGEAGAYLQSLVRGTDGRVSSSAIMPFAIIDSLPRWDVLATAAKDSLRLLRYRRRASDLLARAASLTLPAETGVDDATRSIRREAVNALVRQRQKPDDCIPELLDIARSNPHRDTRVAALYQLGQTADPRAVDLFVSMLRGSR